MKSAFLRSFGLFYTFVGHAGAFTPVSRGRSVPRYTRGLYPPNASRSSNISAVKSKANSQKSIKKTKDAGAKKVDALKAGSASVGQAIQLATSRSELLRVASDMWLPTDDNLPAHLATQLVHHEKRQRWASQLLTKLAMTLISSRTGRTETELGFLLNENLERAVLAAALPPSETDRAEVEGRFLCDSLTAVYAIFGRLYHQHEAQDFNAFISSMEDANSKFKLMDGLRCLVDRAIHVAPGLELSRICQIRWAVRGLSSYLGAELVLRGDQSCIEVLDALVAELPFDILPQAIDWGSWVSVEQPHFLATSENTADAVVQALVSLIPFRKDTIVTRTGSQVVERRGTAWIAAESIGALAYSGKLMPPSPIPESISAVLRTAESRVSSLVSSPFFDCVLCNHYPDGDSACRFHTDPEHGSHWHRTTAVASAGSDRKFAFRPVPERTSWREWDTRESAVNDDAAAWTHLFTGDMVVMTGPCNDDFYHAVRAAEFCGEATNGGERISLVMKCALDRGGGTKGHSLQGQGRRSRRASPGGKTNHQGGARRGRQRRR